MSQNVFYFPLIDFQRQLTRQLWTHGVQPGPTPVIVYGGPPFISWGPMSDSGLLTRSAVIRVLRAADDDDETAAADDADYCGMPNAHAADYRFAERDRIAERVFEPSAFADDHLAPAVRVFQVFFGAEECAPGNAAVRRTMAEWEAYADRFRLAYVPLRFAALADLHRAVCENAHGGDGAALRRFADAALALRHDGLLRDALRYALLHEWGACLVVDAAMRPPRCQMRWVPLAQLVGVDHAHFPTVSLENRFRDVGQQNAALLSPALMFVARAKNPGVARLLAGLSASLAAYAARESPTDVRAEYVSGAYYLTRVLDDAPKLICPISKCRALGMVDYAADDAAAVSAESFIDY